MHSVIGPETEASLLYVEPSHFEKRLARSSGETPLVLWDVGLGIGANSVLAIEKVRELRKQNTHPRPIRIVSFENALDGLRVAMKSIEKFPWLTRNKTEVQSILDHRSWRDSESEIEWCICEGDFSQSLDRLSSLEESLQTPELVYFDFYDPKTCPELWAENLFQKIYAQMKTTETGQKPLLMTYSSSSSVRVNLAKAGFRLGEGPKTPVKKSTTQAAIKFSDLENPLPKEWFLRRGLRPE